MIALSLRDSASRWKIGFPLVGVAIIASIVAAFIDPVRAAAAYLTAFAAVLGIAIALLLLVFMAELSGARWIAPLLPMVDAIVATVPFLALLALPVALGAGKLYPWLWRGVAAASVATTLAEKRPYIHPLFVVARALLYLGVWIAVAEWFRRARTRGYGEQRSAATARLSAVGIILIGVTFAFASFDWLMTLEPNASLAVYAPYYFAGASVGALALLAVIAGVAMRATDHTVVSRDVLDAVGKLLLSFVLLWTYLAYVQYLIIWIGDLPTEIGWVAARTRNGWQSIALVLIIGNCILPTLALLLPVARRNAIPMIVIGAVLLTMHFLDVFWLVTPARFPRAAVPGWIELAALVAIIGLALSGAMWRGVARASPSAAPEKVSL